MIPCLASEHLKDNVKGESSVANNVLLNFLKHSFFFSYTSLPLVGLLMEQVCTINDKLTPQLYEKRDDVGFSIVHLLYFVYSIITCIYVDVPQLISFAKACPTYDKCFNRGKLHLHAVTGIQQSHLKLAFRKLYGR